MANDDDTTQNGLNAFQEAMGDEPSRPAISFLLESRGHTILVIFPHQRRCDFLQHVG